MDKEKIGFQALVNGFPSSLEEWDLYASCYVIGTQAVFDKCKLPQNI